MQTNKVKNKKPMSYIMIFLALAVIVLITCVSLMCTSITTSQSELKRQIERIDNIEAAVAQGEMSVNTDTKLYEYYRELSNRTEDAIANIITVVGIVAGAFAFLGILIAFKAPRDIEKEMDVLDKKYSELNDYVEEARYQTEIIEALTVEYSGKLTKHQKLRELNKVISKYPNKPKGYLLRGFFYCVLQEIDKSISDYEIAKKLGCSLENYNDYMGISMQTKGENKKAIKYYTSSIKENNENISAYCNRGLSYLLLNQLDNALRDFNKVIDIDDECASAYYLRSILLGKQYLEEKNFSIRDKLLEGYRLDAERAYNLDKENESFKEHYERIK